MPYEQTVGIRYSNTVMNNATRFRRVSLAAAATAAIGFLVACPQPDGSEPSVTPEPDAQQPDVGLPVEPDVVTPEPGTPEPGAEPGVTPEPGAEPGVTPEPGAEPEACAPAAEAVPYLPRASNHEVWQLYSDLVGAPVDAELFSRWTPLAQVRGFDHMTESRIDAQTLDEQLRTTEAVADLLMNTSELFASCPAPMAQTPQCPLHATYDAQTQFSTTQNADCWSYHDGNGNLLAYDAGTQRWGTFTDSVALIWRTGMHPGANMDVFRRWTAPVDGVVTMTGSFSDADPGGGDGIIVRIRNASGDVFNTSIVNGGAPAPFNVTFNVTRGEAVDIVVNRNGNNAWDTTGLSATLNFTEAPPSAGLGWSNCARDIVDHVASRAWRRPLRPAERTDLQTVFDEVVTSANAAGVANAFQDGLKATLQAALLSPHVQYKPEFVPGGTQVGEESFRRASRLALFFRGSFPDDDLWAAAEAGVLSDADLEVQARRLLAADGDRFVQNFGGQWLAFRGAIGEEQTALQHSMRQEAHDVFAAILDDNLPAADLVEPGFTIVDGTLASHYGLSGVDANAGPTRVSTTERGGLFEQGHFLTSAGSGSDFKRVIHRGIYALNRTLCMSIPPLDPATLEEIAASTESIDPNLPLSERMQQHRTSSNRCLGCHSQMDPLGLALEQFDDEGRHRMTYPDGSAIDNDFDFNGNSVRNTEELKAYVSGSDFYRRCVAEKLFNYGLHRAPRNEEYCVVDELVPDDEPPPSLHDLAIDAFITSLELTETP